MEQLAVQIPHSKQFLSFSAFMSSSMISLEVIASVVPKHSPRCAWYYWRRGPNIKVYKRKVSQQSDIRIGEATHFINFNKNSESTRGKSVRKVKVALYGVGVVGGLIAKFLLEKEGVEIVGAVDTAKDKIF